MLKRNYLYILIVFMLVTSNIYAQSQDPPTEDDLKRHIIKRELIDVAEGKWHYKVEYPELRLAGDQDHEGFNLEAKKIAMEQIKDFRKSMSEMTEEDWKNKPTGHEYEMAFGYEIELLNDDFISVNFGRYEFTGGAHGNSWTITLNYDLKNNRVLKLSELFKANSNYLNIISKTSIEQITKKQGEYAAVDFIKAGASPKAGNFEKWNMTEQGLKFNFDPYEVGPYAAGPFETIVPYSQFLDRMKADMFYRVLTASYIDGNPANWCRNGHFPSQKVDFKLAFVKGEKNEKVYFHDDDKDECPDSENCKKTSYLIPQDEVIIGRTFNKYACAWYQPENGSETVGWLPLEKLTIQETKSPNYNWAGEWSYYDNDLKFVPEKTVGDFIVSGNAFWKGLGDNVHTGDIGEVKVTPRNGLLEFGSKEEYECGVKMQRVGKYLIVNDNNNCGGANVTFDGVYVQNVKTVADEGADAVCSTNDFAEMTYGSEKDLNFRLGSIKTKKNQKAFFMDTDGSKVNSYLVQGDEVIVSKTKNNSACVWFQPKKGKETVGWISFDNLAFKPSSSIRQDWVGTWEYGEGEIKVIPQKRVGAYKFMGKTFWVGKGEGNVNIGDIDFVASPIANRLTSNGTKDLPECKVKMYLLGDFMIVSDNEKCGGRNVKFFGVYRKK